MVTLAHPAGTETGGKTTGTRDTEIMIRGGGGVIGPEIEIVNMVIDIMIVQVREIRYIPTLAGPGVVTCRGGNMRTTQAVGTEMSNMGGTDPVGTDTSDKTQILYIRPEPVLTMNINMLNLCQEIPDCNVKGAL